MRRRDKKLILFIISIAGQLMRCPDACVTDRSLLSYYKLLRCGPVVWLSDVAAISNKSVHISRYFVMYLSNYSYYLYN